MTTACPIQELSPSHPSCLSGPSHIPRGMQMALSLRLRVVDEDKREADTPSVRYWREEGRLPTAGCWEHMEWGLEW